MTADRWLLLLVLVVNYVLLFLAVQRIQRLRDQYDRAPGMPEAHRLLEALKKYGTHTTSCALSGQVGVTSIPYRPPWTEEDYMYGCNCSLTTAITEASATLERRRMWRAPLLLFLLLGGGCAPSNLAEVIKAAGNDNATVCTRVTTIYGTLTFMRSNVMGGDVSCDTLTIKTVPKPVEAVIPMNITPTFTITPKP